MAILRMISNRLINIPCYRGLRESFLLLEERVVKQILKRQRASANWSAISHGLDAALVVSLTSYPGRFDVLPWTLLSLLRQSVRPDRLILWVAAEHIDLLPLEIIDMKEVGVDVFQCPDLVSYKKIVPALSMFPDAYIVTADDDLYYPKDWLLQLVDGYSSQLREPVAHRVHRITLDENGLPNCYADWLHGYTSKGADVLNFPTSGAGVLYPPNSFHEDVVKHEIFMKLCPYADDVWLYWMLRMRGHIAVNLKGNFRLRAWKAARERPSLFEKNVVLGRNDNQINALIDYYGFPASEPNEVLSK